jgi:molybdenum cofactor cytidylyltransferase
MPVHPTASRPVTAVIVLAAGASARFGDADKLTATVAGRTLLEWSLALVNRQVGDGRGAPHVLVVVRTPETHAAHIAGEAGCTPVIAQHAARGMAWSARAGLDAVTELGAAGAVVLLADDPLATLELGQVLAHARARAEIPALIARPAGPPHPVYVPARLAAAFEPAPDGARADRGLARMLAADASCVRLGPDPANPPPLDADTPDALARLAKVLATPALQRLRSRSARIPR